MVAICRIFRILMLSEFGYPISALLVNVLSSRGNSKSFLRLEIYKKIIMVINLAVGFIWGIEGYLYGLFLATIICVILNIYFASHEMNLPKIKFLKPIVIQMLLTVTVTLLVQFLDKNLELGYIATFLLKGFEFSILYIYFNQILNTEGFKYFMNEAKPIYNSLFKKR